MKKLFASLLPLLLLLTACGETVQTAENIQTQYSQLATADLAAKVTCHLSGETRSYELTCTVTKDGASTTVTAPEELAGITATVTPDGLTVTYDGMALSAGDLYDVCPANCLPYLLRAIADGYLMEQGTEELNGVSCYRMALDTTAKSGEKVLCTVWIDQNTLIPRYAEFAQNDTVLLTAELTAFQCTLTEE